MTWFIEGSSDNLHIGVSDDGHNEIWGDASTHELSLSIYNEQTDYNTINKLNSTPVSWSIHDHLPGIYCQFEEQMTKTESKSFAIISFHNKPDLFGVAIILSPDLFSRVKELFRDVLVSDNLSYRIIISFIGFPAEGINCGLPTMKEFMLGEKYLDDSISFSIMRRILR